MFLSPTSGPCWGVVACLIGLVWLWPTHGDEPPGSGHPDGGRAKRLEKGSTTPVTVSRQRREISTRKAYFAFHEVRPGSKEAEFLARRPDVAEMVQERREKAEERLTLRAGGLGRKHPGIKSLDRSIEELEEEVMEQWSRHRSWR